MFETEPCRIVAEGISPSLPECMYADCSLPHFILCISYLFHCCDKILDQKNQLQEGLVYCGSYFEDVVYHSEKGVVAGAHVKQLLILSLQLVGRER